MSVQSNQAVLEFTSKDHLLAFVRVSGLSGVKGNDMTPEELKTARPETHMTLTFPTQFDRDRFVREYPQHQQQFSPIFDHAKVLPITPDPTTDERFLVVLEGTEDTFAFLVDRDTWNKINDDNDRALQAMPPTGCFASVRTAKAHAKKSGITIVDRFNGIFY